MDALLIVTSGLISNVLVVKIKLTLLFPTFING